MSGIPSHQRIGEKHNMFTIIKITGVRNSGKRSKTLCLARCECGNEREMLIESIVNRSQYSCGCNRKKFISPYRKKYTGYRNSAGYRGYYFNLTQEEFDSIIIQDCHYCGSPESLGIDRKDNNTGYDINNAVPCCFICNRAKSDMSYSDFTSWIRRMRNVAKKTN